MVLKIGELAARAKVSAHTLRYYERIGLMPRAARDASGQRDYDSGDLVWIAFLGRLKTTGMSMAERLRYAALRAEGPATAPERRRLLQAHRQRVTERVAELQACLLVQEAKIAGYGGEERDTSHDARPAIEPLPKGLGGAETH